MGEKRNYAPLEWVIGEIAEALNDARQALEAYAEDPKDSTRLRFCLSHIHQVHSTLKMVEFNGAILFAEETEHLAQAILNNSVAHLDEAQEVLMRSLLQLPIYLEHVIEARDDHPGVVLSLLNDMRAVRKQSYLSESNLFSPDMSSIDAISGQPHPITEDRTKFKQVLGKLREMYQYSAASVLRGIKLEEYLVYIDKVFTRLESLTRGTAAHALWQAASGLMDCLVRDEVELSVAVKTILRTLAREMRVLEENCPSALHAPPNANLIRNILYYIARSEDWSARVEQLNERYNLRDALMDNSVEGRGFNKAMISGPDKDAIRAVVGALSDEINAIKQLLTHLLSEQGSVSDLEEALPIVKRVADTLALLGIQDLRSDALEQHRILQEMCENHDLSPEAIEGVASKIVAVEHRLEAIDKGADKLRDFNQIDERQVEIDVAQRKVVSECREGLDKLKDHIMEYHSHGNDRSHLVDVPNLLSDIRGGLNIIPLPRAVAIIDACAKFVEDKFINAEQNPESSLLVALANIVESVDYFLERFVGEHDQDIDQFLMLAEQSLQDIGHAVPGVELPSSEFTGETISEETDGTEADANAGWETSVDASPVEDNSSELSLADEQAEAQDDATASPEPAIEGLPEGVNIDDVLDSDIDPEIVEIFIEEAREVMDSIADQLSLWAADLENEEALTTIRRNFHTLKGSGRIVQAVAIGELAWSVENMLNRVIDMTVPPSEAHAELIERVVALLPLMVDAFERQQPIPAKQTVLQFIAWAEGLSQGQQPDFDAIPSAPSTDKPEPADITLVEPTPVEADSLNEEQAADFSEEMSEASLQSEDIEEASELELPDAIELADDEDDEHDAESSAESESSVEPEFADEDEDYVLLELFASETRVHLKTADDFVNQMEESAPLFEVPSDLLQKALHTLKGSAHMAEVTPVALLVTPLESLLKEMRAYQVKVDDDILQLLKDASQYINEALVQIEDRVEVEIPKLDLYVARVNELTELRVGHLIRSKDQGEGEHREVDPRLLSIIMAEEMALLLDADQVLARWAEASAQIEEQEAVIAELGTLQDGASQANLPQMAELSGDLKAAHEAVLNKEIDLVPEIFDILNPAHEALLDMVDCVAAGQDMQLPSAELWQLLKDMTAETPAQSSDEAAEIDETAEIVVEEAPEIEPESESSAVVATSLFDGSYDTVAGDEAEEGDTATLVEQEAQPLVAELAADEISETGSIVAEGEIEFDFGDLSQQGGDEIDAEILEVFLDEADELIEELDEAIHDWDSNWENREAEDVMKRALHTLKGGARLAGLNKIGDLTHEYETYLINSTGPQGDTNFFNTIHQYQDHVLKGVKVVKDYLESDASADDEANHEMPVTEVPRTEGKVSGPEVADNVYPIGKAIPTPIEQKAPAVASEFKMPPSPAAADGSSQQLTSANKRQGSQEVVKISADLLEELVNLAGETSISRGRLEQQVTDFGSAIHEMDTTIRRLQEQIRRLDIETEAQILFRQEQMAEQDSFDPLEMDRYSQLQQLSRSLTESASDLVDLKSTLGDKVKDTESLLLHQQRINSSLQEGLMRARMVPFSRLVPRLRRIVRQVSSELGKQVNFELDNVEGEMDRSVLEHMVAPLEHMLRNAVDHGIEKPEDRVAAGKPETGRILLSFAREGGDILLRLADDGRGIALDKVRKKAIEQGLMSEDADLSDHDIMQFILQAGFSTRENVTQISGRGVGMDVVAAEIKQLGGSMSIESKSGVGTQFTVRLPFTVSVNRALMVTIGQENYAIPLNSIEGIVRVSPFELEHYYSEEDARFEYAGEEYQVRYLGSMLSESLLPRLEGQTLPVPVILVRSAQHAMALQVDGLQGSREIVVKSLGPQFAAVQGLSGATVMGDGSVVVILDPHALVRRSVATAGLAAPYQAHQLTAPEPKSLLKTVMVVDDSVTVRKVTSRFLEREGYNVLTAYDGVDALQKLQEQVPDVMLLDIEMPRMDGFELAKNIRTTEQWEDLPIIMITSRTGDKHRDHALNIGVNHYLGKPYQEEVLLGHIRELLGEGAA